MSPTEGRPETPREADVERLRTVHHEIMIPMLAWAVEEYLAEDA